MNTQRIARSLFRIGWPADAARQAQLRKKMEEYRFRLKMPLYDYMETAYKIIVLERLLSEGSVDPVALATELAADPTKHFDHGHFYNALAVVESYCLDGGVRAFGGTGLPGAD